MTERREQVLAWTGAVLTALYFGWLTVALLRGAAGFGAIYQSLGAAVPPATQFLVHHYRWLYPVMLGVSAVLVLGKEFLLRDKRSSLMVTLLVVIVVRWIVDVTIALYYVPLLAMIDKLK